MAASASSTSAQTTATPRRQLIFRALEAKSLRSRSMMTRFADYLTGLCSTPTFLFLNLVVFGLWITVNLGVIPGFQPFDPYPFGFLTMGVSLEAIALSIFVLVSQNRAAQTGTLRDELNLRVNMISEREITKILEILSEMRGKMNIKTEDPVLEEMLKEISASTLEQSITQQIERADQPLVKSTLTKGEFGSFLTNLVKPRHRHS